MSIINAYQTTKIITLFKSGVVIILPTDTVYGLAAIPSPATKNQIFKLKKRSFDHPLGLIVDSKNTAQQIIVWNPKIESIFHTHQSKSVTIIGYGRCDWSLFNLVHFHGLIGVRITKSLWLQRLIRQIGPIWATSANISGQPPITNENELIKIGCRYLVKGLKETGSGHPSPIYHAVLDRWIRK